MAQQLPHPASTTDVYLRAVLDRLDRLIALADPPQPADEPPSPAPAPRAPRKRAPRRPPTASE